MVANEVSSGITKLSGFKPLLNVKIAIPKDKSTIPVTPIMLDTQIIIIKLSTLDSGNTRLIARDMRAKTVDIKSEAVHALVMFLVWFFIEEKEGLSKPKASLVLAVEPTTEPTLLTMLIKAG